MTLDERIKETEEDLENCLKDWWDGESPAFLRRKLQALKELKAEREKE